MIGVVINRDSRPELLVVICGPEKPQRQWAVLPGEALTTVRRLSKRNRYMVVVPELTKIWQNALFEF